MEFVLKGSIIDQARENGGTMGSWSWNESNFHKNDTFDLSYSNPNYQPSYDISGFTEEELDIGI